MSFPKVLGQSQVEARYGSFQWEPNGKKAINILGDWVEQNLTTVYVPQLDGIMCYGSKFSGRVRWHRSGVEQLLRAFAEIEKAGFKKDVLMWGGSFVPRRMVGRSSLSRHSWGIAFDVNVSQNGWMVKPPVHGQVGSLMRVAPIFEKHGFAWGGRWEKTPDGMHFELAEQPNYGQMEEVPGAKLIIEGCDEPINVILKEGVSFASLNALAKATKDVGVIVDRQVPVGQYLTARGYLVSWNSAKKQVEAVKPKSKP